MNPFILTSCISSSFCARISCPCCNDSNITETDEQSRRTTLNLDVVVWMPLHFKTSLLSTEVYVRGHDFVSGISGSDLITCQFFPQPKWLIEGAAITHVCLLMVCTQTRSRWILASLSSLMDNGSLLSSGVPAEVIFRRYPLITHHLVFMAHVFITVSLIAHWMNGTDSPSTISASQMESSLLYW